MLTVSSMITVPVNTSLYQTVVQQISDGSIQVKLCGNHLNMFYFNILLLCLGCHTSNAYAQVRARWWNGFIKW